MGDRTHDVTEKRDAEGSCRALDVDEGLKSRALGLSGEEARWIDRRKDSFCGLVIN